MTQHKMKLKEGFLTHNTGKEQILVGAAGTGFNGMVRSNETAAFVVDLLKEETDEKSLILAMMEEYGIQEEIARQEVKKVLDVLREIGALD